MSNSLDYNPRIRAAPGVEADALMDRVVNVEGFDRSATFVKALTGWRSRWRVWIAPCLNREVMTVHGGSNLSFLS
jgi:hypothetical protein